MTPEMPKLPQRLMEKIREDADRGTYRINIDGIKIDVFPYIFPPESGISKSSQISQEINCRGKILDVGTGTGILAIASILRGAKQADSVDILPEAVECARHNVRLNGLQNKIRVFQSDLFCSVEGSYDLIVANLPILDYPEEDIRFHSLSDPGFRYHQRFFACARDYLRNKARILMPHANLQTNGFKKLELLAELNGFKHKVCGEQEFNGYTWRNYKLK